MAEGSSPDDDEKLFLRSLRASRAIKNDFNPKCKRNSIFINQLYVELGYCLATNFNPNSLRITLIITTSKLNIYNSSMKSITLPGLVIESVQ